MEKPLLQLQYTLADIHSAAKNFWQFAKDHRVFAFSGDMGAGKTTFIHALCDNLKVADTVSSPTFALINEYHFTDDLGRDNTIYHMDWYRVKTEDEAMQAGMEDCITEAVNGNAYCLIEWPERAQRLLPRSTLFVHISSPGISERKMTINNTL